MNITPALPNTYQPPVDRDRAAVAAVRAPSRTRDPVDQPDRGRQSLQRVDQPERERLAGQVEHRLERHRDTSSRATRALASYAEVADGAERNGLQDLLGFDAYA